jgi:hypothetical protein
MHVCTVTTLHKSVTHIKRYTNSYNNTKRLPLFAVSVSAACPATQGLLLCQGALVLSESSHHGLLHGLVLLAVLILLQCRRGFRKHRPQYCPTALQCPSETV